MTTQVSFVADQNLKAQALEKAKSEGITLKAFLIFAMKSYVDGKISLGIETIDSEPDVELIRFNDKSIYEKAEKIAKLLK
ncbi:hypothetical protein HY463_00905 [Candidatus Peregrinibacteria bacterium]|nr:hypothetical protein [Candidatus Peregrinibacteria bacterium]